MPQYATWAMSRSGSRVDGIPRTPTSPSAISRSPGSASSRCEAMSSSRRRTSTAAAEAAPALTTADRLAQTPLPCGATAVSPDSTRTSSSRTPRPSATTCAAVVCRP